MPHPLCWYVIKEKVFGIEFQKVLSMRVHHWERKGGGGGGHCQFTCSSLLAS